MGEFDKQRVAIACVTYSRMYEAQLNYGNIRLEIVLYFFRS